MPWTPLPEKSTARPMTSKAGKLTADAKSLLTLRRPPSGREEHEKILIPLRRAPLAVTMTSARASNSRMKRMREPSAQRWQRLLLHP